jgi:rRNA pseudouridine-1189 N-methylase Emg1 (Nep1/Mra1 family)
MIAIGGFTKAHNALLSLMDLSQRKKCDFRHVVLKRFTEIERNDFSFIYIHLLVGMSMCLKPIVRLQKATFDLVHHPMSLAMSSCPSRRFNISWWNTTTLKG